MDNGTARPRIATNATARAAAGREWGWLGARVAAGRLPRAGSRPCREPQRASGGQAAQRRVLSGPRLDACIEHWCSPSRKTQLMQGRQSPPMSVYLTAAAAAAAAAAAEE